MRVSRTNPHPSKQVDQSRQILRPKARVITHVYDDKVLNLLMLILILVYFVECYIMKIFVKLSSKSESYFRRRYQLQVCLHVTSTFTSSDF